MVENDISNAQDDKSTFDSRLHNYPSHGGELSRRCEYGVEDLRRFR